ncbi:lipoprotein, putative [Roseobacter sp. SK209-2-6]|uniref:hypothetical protein n=1 Tax=Roseobacter sp. SK209-2-6 TaxID=388739 RepID=UPI0000F3F640|nr:hypothetical protein [Roseobacter sp. SK209-2-6]EBA17623.1 lipoprotein, putative [Roseobacter sp. SK209-2-6]
MRKSLVIFLVGTLAVSSCGFRDSRVNPLNWFGKSRSVEVASTSTEATNPLIPVTDRIGLFARAEAEDKSVLAKEILALKVEPTPAGAIIHATALGARQGAHKLALRAIETEDPSVLEYEFRVIYPESATQTGSTHSRTLNVAVTLSKQDLRGTKLIRVKGSSNIRETRRR